jgi:hypothetical protein
MSLRPATDLDKNGYRSDRRDWSRHHCGHLLSLPRMHGNAGAHECKQKGYNSVGRAPSTRLTWRIDRIRVIKLSFLVLINRKQIFH